MEVELAKIMGDSARLSGIIVLFKHIYTKAQFYCRKAGDICFAIFSPTHKIVYISG